MDIRQLRQFLAVVDTGSFTKAADTLLVAQPSLSQTIKGLERELGVTLFHRLGRTVSLSEAGKELEGPARLVVRDLETAEAHVQGLRGLQSGRIQIAAMPSPSIEPLTTLMSAFARAHPQIAFDLHGTFTVDETIEAVRYGRAEVGFLGGREPLQVNDLRVIQLADQPLMLAHNPEFSQFSDAEAVAPESLSGTRLVVSHKGSLMRAYVDELIDSGTDIDIAAEVTHRSSILPLVKAGIGHAVLPASWQSFADAGQVRLLPIASAPSLHVSAIARAEGLTPAAGRFLKMVRDLAA
ncbi:MULTISPECIES: LysR family transcriptional regulator [Brevibacterium]|uniref:DNA-binding transcriptional regulator, LysR family n=2 Tax=Brevibacterium TaxID=1696 RepID=A0A1H1T3E4_BRESA|nr:LysR family transcriptional regulator [Brevibacterium sandarakinum]SDS54747.1 DNA-binding transcriptional regulator, LysR family [Brevibacterium sandarakinum]